MRITKILNFGLLCGVSLLCVGQASADIVLFEDNFDDNIVTGWTFLDRDGEDEIANANWVEQDGQLQQLTTNFDFSRSPINNSPTLGTIALSASGAIGGEYTISADFDSLEDTNDFQDQSIVFGYVDADNFFYVETGASGADSFELNQVVAGERTTVSTQVPITFQQDSTPLSVTVDTLTGTVSAIYDDGDSVELATGLTIATGLNGVGSNNDAFAIDNFVITTTAVPEPSSLALLGLVSLGVMVRRRK